MLACARVCVSNPCRAGADYDLGLRVPQITSGGGVGVLGVKEGVEEDIGLCVYVSMRF